MTRVLSFAVPDSGAKRRLVLFAAFALLILVALGLHAIQDGWNGIAHMLASGAKQEFWTGSAAGLASAGLHAGLWLAMLVIRPLLILGAFFLVEWALVGPPKSWSNSLFCLSAQVSLAILYYFLNPWLAYLLPTELLDPALRLSHDHLPALLAPVADVLLFFAAFFVVGIAGYWAHRLQHQIPILWRFHSVHHSIPHMDALNDVSHPFDIIGERVAIVILSVLIGFEYEAFALLIALQSVRSRMIHSRAPINFGPIGWLIVDNRFHLSHHSLRPKYYDRNYGNTITLYDRMFGTYVAPERGEKEEAGLVHKVPPRNLWQFMTAKLEDRPARVAGATGGRDSAPRAC